MQYLLFGLVALTLCLWAMQSAATAAPGALARQVRTTAGGAALLAGAIMLVRGPVLLGAGLASAGLWALLANRLNLPRWGQTGAASPNTSRITTDHLDLELERDTGVIRGTILKGFFADRDIETLRPVELAHLWSDCQFADPQSAQVLEAYLDRIHPTWRDDMARSGSGATDGGHAVPDDGTMTPAHALEILGLTAGATAADIRHAHRELMLKLHPDRGGSHTLAAKVNEAKQVLLSRTT
jgi:DnaJ domain